MLHIRCSKQTAKENRVALKAFFEEFPQFKQNDFYVVGESYGGIYVPTLVAEIIDGQDDYKMNLKVNIQCDKMNSNAMQAPLTFRDSVSEMVVLAQI